MRPTLRLLTVLCYFLPFTFFLTTCNRFDLYIAYNKEEAKKNNLKAQESDKLIYDTAATDTAQKGNDRITDTAHASSAKSNPTDTVQSGTSTTSNKDSFWEKIKLRMVMPTNSSLSGIGSIFLYKNITGQILIAASLLVSLILLVAWKFLKRKNSTWYLLSVNFICLLAFITDGYISEVGILFGTWIVLILIAIQLGAEINDRKKINLQNQAL